MTERAWDVYREDVTFFLRLYMGRVLSYTYTGGFFCGIGHLTGILNIDFHLKINGFVTDCKCKDLVTA